MSGPCQPSWLSVVSRGVRIGGQLWWRVADGHAKASPVIVHRKPPWCWAAKSISHLTCEIFAASRLCGAYRGAARSVEGFSSTIAFKCWMLHGSFETTVVPWRSAKLARLLLLMVIVALGLGWCADHYHRSDENTFYQEALMWRTRARGLYGYSMVTSQPGTKVEFDSDGTPIVTTYASKRESKIPPW